ncbi:class I SAM-dependent methyltransferase [Metabacillus halosaccharovorans]|uniref:class I SAM-dependent methyltransferase n=1 Tax=Metabacillus halosaccharovorans TaxID=930124 RepID=UPI00203E269C|nr:class I SAM-dependent methyltransferase [Metabacillus halosaccharovorans]MCM3443749.1 class I SAM-dependent methyltransferase [Metabacillus halosaccharovorans]
MFKETEVLDYFTKGRIDFWVNFINKRKIKTMAEIGVFKGHFAEQILKHCPSIERYYMIDPWENLVDWNKPANVDSNEFDRIYHEAKSRTNFAKEKVVILRGKSKNVINEIPDNRLDFIYIDGDHTLRGITIDIILAFAKVKENCFIGGDDFSSTIFQHSLDYEPTFVFPFTIYFSEAKNVPIYALPNSQFLIHKNYTIGYKFIDFTNNYKNVFVKPHIDNLVSVIYQKLILDKQTKNGE